MTSSVFGQKVDQKISSTDELRKVASLPSRHVDNKVIDHIDSLSARFIAASPLTILSTTRSDGSVDTTPRGDPPGFVSVLNKNLIAIPDRPGNNRMDSFENLFDAPDVGLIFIIPGFNDTLRVSGKGALVRDRELADRLAIKNRPPELILLVKVERVLCHCPKAFVRGRIWKPDYWPDTSDVPTLAEMMVAHGALADSVDEIEEIVRNDGIKRLY